MDDLLRNPRFLVGFAFLFVIFTIVVHVMWADACEARGDTFRYGYTSQGYAYYCDEE